MYRTKDWKNPYPDEVKIPLITDIPATRTMLHRAYEAGADALLQRLFDKGLRVNNFGDIHGKGTVIFIPDEEVTDAP